MLYLIICFAIFYIIRNSKEITNISNARGKARWEKKKIKCKNMEFIADIKSREKIGKTFLIILIIEGIQLGIFEKIWQYLLKGLSNLVEIVNFYNFDFFKYVVEYMITPNPTHNIILCSQLAGGMLAFGYLFILIWWFCISKHGFLKSIFRYIEERETIIQEVLSDELIDIDVEESLEDLRLTSDMREKEVLLFMDNLLKYLNIGLAFFVMYIINNVTLESLINIPLLLI